MSVSAEYAQWLDHRVDVNGSTTDVSSNPSISTFSVNWQPIALLKLSAIRTHPLRAESAEQCSGGTTAEPGRTTGQTAPCDSFHGRRQPHVGATPRLC